MPRKKIIKKAELDYIIISDYITEGFFATVITWLIEIVYLCDQYQFFPHFIIRTKNYGIKENDYNIIPEIINYNYQNFSKVLPENFDKFICKKTDSKVYLSLEKMKKYNDSIQPSYFLKDFKKVNQLLFKYFKFNDIVYEKINQNLKDDNNILGIQLRGTDKLTDKYLNPNNLSLQELFKRIDKILEKNNYDKIFLATDSQDFFNKFKEKYNKYDILFNPMIRYQDNESPFRTIDNRNPWEKRKFNDESNNLNSAYNVIIDSISLSKCKMVVFNSSAVASWSKVFNPELEIYRFNHNQAPWFPYKYIEQYKDD